MPYQARLGAPDTLHSVMVRGIERTTIFRDDPDRADFVIRLPLAAYLHESGQSHVLGRPMRNTTEGVSNDAGDLHHAILRNMNSGRQEDRRRLHE